MRARKSWRKKLKQEKRALYLQGLMDSQDGLGRRWERHEHMEHYERGYHHGMKWFPRPRQTATQEHKGFWRKMLAKLFGEAA